MKTILILCLLLVGQNTFASNLNKSLTASVGCEILTRSFIDGEPQPPKTILSRQWAPFRADLVNSEVVALPAPFADLELYFSYTTSAFDDELDKWYITFATFMFRNGNAPALAVRDVFLDSSTIQPGMKIILAETVEKKENTYTNYKCTLEFN